MQVRQRRRDAAADPRTFLSPPHTARPEKTCGDSWICIGSDALTAAVAGSIEEFTKFLAVLRTVDADCDPCMCNNAAAVVHP